LEDPDDLISPAHSSPGDLIRPLSCDLLTAEIDMSLVRLKNPGDEVEEGRLSSAIGTDQAVIVPAWISKEQWSRAITPQTF